MECPICMTAIKLQDEAFVGSCYHRFCHKCISEWTLQQRKHPLPDTGRPDYRCPMCKQTYSYVLYDCVLNSYRVEYVDGDEKRASGSTVVGRGVFLTAGHRRRRALYIKPVPAGEQGSGGNLPQLTQQQQQQAGSGSSRRVPPATASVRTADDAEVRAFVERELQAVLLQEDVSLVLQHVLGVLRGVLGGSSASNSGARGRGGSRGAPPAKRARSSSAHMPEQQEFETVVSRELASFLQNDSAMFARELHLFLNRGLNVRAYDTLVFGPEVAPEVGGAAAQRGAERSSAERVEGPRPSSRSDVRDVVDLISDDDGDDFEEV